MKIKFTFQYKAFQSIEGPFQWMLIFLQQDREVDMLTITDPASENVENLDLHKEKKQIKKRVVMVIARQQPSESPSSLIVQGMIDFLLSKHKIAAQLREKLIFKIIPMMNPDGVFLGNTKGSLFGSDLNR